MQHDVQGLIDLMGGREAFVAKLDALFVEQYIMDKPAFWGQFPDMSGLIGQYAHGNEYRASTSPTSTTMPGSRGRRSGVSATS